jgi:hypothetical protein
VATRQQTKLQKIITAVTKVNVQQGSTSFHIGEKVDAPLNSARPDWIAVKMIGRLPTLAAGLRKKS